MQAHAASRHDPGNPTFAELFTPKIVTVFREGYGLDGLRADVVAALTVAIVALPLSMAIAIASGTTPDRGLYTAIVGGFLVSALGGSRFQIGGPAGAFIVLVAAAVHDIGIEGTILATAMSGLFLMAAGFLRLGTYVKFIPYPVTVGFTAGIAVIIAASQIRDLLGLTLTAPEPAEIIPKLQTLAGALGTLNVAAVALAAITVAIITAVRIYRPTWPGMLIAVALTAAAVALLDLPVETIGSKFGGIPRSLPMPALPDLGPEHLLAALPHAISFALLGAIESLLSAVVADGMTGRRHRSNCELVAQGVANIGSAIFGGICVTGTIARTATNVRSGARGPVSGMLHSAFLLVFMLVAAPLASLIPLAALAGILVTVAWNMAERREFALLVRSGWGDALVLLATFLLTIFRDLSEGILVGFSLGSLLFIARMSQTIGVDTMVPLAQRDVADDEARPHYEAETATDPDVMVYRISGAFFFGAASAVGSVLDRISPSFKAFIVDFEAVPFVDSTAANVMAGFAKRAQKHGVRLYITGASVTVRQGLVTHGVREPMAHYRRTIDDAMAEAKDGPPNGGGAAG